MRNNAEKIWGEITRRALNFRAQRQIQTADYNLVTKNH